MRGDASGWRGQRLHAGARRVVVLQEPRDGLVQSCVALRVDSVSVCAREREWRRGPVSNGVNSKSGSSLSSLAFEAVFLNCPSALVVSN